MALTVHQLIKQLANYNPEALVHVFVDGRDRPFKIIHAGAEGLTIHYAERVSFYVEQSRSVNPPRYGIRHPRARG